MAIALHAAALLTLAVGVTFLVHFVAALAGSRGRHLSWLVFLAVGLLATAATAAAEPVDVPYGDPPVVDGVLTDGEWDDALSLPLAGGEAVLLKRDGDQLHLAIRSGHGGFGSLGWCTADTVRILHASTGLIEARYERRSGVWVRVEGFRGPEIRPGEIYPRGEIRRGAQYREDAWAQFGWTASLVEAAPPTEQEFRIDRGRLGRGTVRLSVVYFQVRAPGGNARLPADLADASLFRELLAGGAPDTLGFAPETWLEIR